MSSHSRFVTVNIYRREYLTLDHTGRLRTRSSSTFKGMYKGVAYNTSAPPGKIFSNHNLCIEFNQFIGEYTSACAFARGNVKIWGQGGRGGTSPVGPFLACGTIEATIVFRRPFFHNLWMNDSHFPWDKLLEVPRFLCAVQVFYLSVGKIIFMSISR